MTRDDDGAVTLYVVIMMTALMAAFGLVVDVGAATEAKGQAIHAAYAAARAGAEALSPEAFITSGHVTLDPTAARQAALTYLQHAGLAASAKVTITGSTVRVEVQQTTRAHILSAFGFGSFTVTGAGQATAKYGVQGTSP